MQLLLRPNQYELDPLDYEALTSTAPLGREGYAFSALAENLV